MVGGGYGSFLLLVVMQNLYFSFFGSFENVFVFLGQLHSRDTFFAIFGSKDAQNLME